MQSINTIIRIYCTSRSRFSPCPQYIIFVRTHTILSRRGQRCSQLLEKRDQLLRDTVKLEAFLLKIKMNRCPQFSKYPGAGGVC